MTTLRTLLVLAFAAAPLAAQSAELSVSLGQSIIREGNLGTTDAVASINNLIKARSGFRTNVRFTLNTGRFIGHELNYAYSRTKFDYQNTTYGLPSHQYGYNFLFYPVPEGLPIRPFVTGGANFMSYYPPGASAFQGNGITKFGINYGAGVKVKVSPMFHVRLDVREYINGKPLDLYNQSGKLHTIEASAGIGIHF